jgi:hypothetical protein
MRWVLVVVLLAHIAVHFGTIGVLAWKTELRWRALFAFALPPLAPFWAWDTHRTWWLRAWAATFFGYALLRVIVH